MTRRKMNYSAVPGELVACFAGQNQSLQSVFGQESMPIGVMEAKLWRFLKRHRLLEPMAVAPKRPVVHPNHKKRNSRHHK
jgi:hypothetical protein